MGFFGNNGSRGNRGRKRVTRGRRRPSGGRNNRFGVGQHTHGADHGHVLPWHQHGGGTFNGNTGYQLGTQDGGKTGAAYHSGSIAETNNFQSGRAGGHRHGGAQGIPPRPITGGGRRRGRTTYKRRK